MYFLSLSSLIALCTVLIGTSNVSDICNCVSLSFSSIIFKTNSELQDKRIKKRLTDFQSNESHNERLTLANGHINTSEPRKSNMVLRYQ